MSVQRFFLLVLPSVLDVDGWLDAGFALLDPLLVRSLETVAEILGHPTEGKKEKKMHWLMLVPKYAFKSDIQERSEKKKDGLHDDMIVVTAGHHQARVDGAEGRAPDVL